MQPLKSTNAKLLSFSHILPPDEIASIFSNSEVSHLPAPFFVLTNILGVVESAYRDTR